MWQQCALSINRLLLHTSIFNPHILYLAICMLSHAWHQEHGFALGADWFVLIFFLLICVCCDRSDVFTFNWYQLLENCCVDCTIWVDGEYWFFSVTVFYHIIVQPRTPLEEEVAAVLRGSAHVLERSNKELTEEEEKALLAMDLEEVRVLKHNEMNHMLSSENDQTRTHCVQNPWYLGLPPPLQ